MDKRASERHFHGLPEQVEDIIIRHHMFLPDGKLGHYPFLRTDHKHPC